MASLFIDMLQIGATSVEAKKLKDFKAPKANFHGTDTDYNDFASVLFKVIESRCYDSKGVTVADINKSLDQIITVNEAEGKKSVAMLLRELFKKMNATELKWLGRLILKQMPLGGEVSILRAFHPDAKGRYISFTSN